MKMTPVPVKTTSSLRLLPLLLVLSLAFFAGCRKEVVVAEDPAIQAPNTYVAPPAEVRPEAAANPARDGAVSRNAPAVPQSTSDEVVDKPDPDGGD